MPLTFLVYDAIMQVYAAGIRISTLFNLKARQWVAGRKDWLEKLRRAIPPTGADLWLHCASLGEFEQGRPVLETYRETHPGRFILVTFFSPSGYEIRKNYPGADYVCYLPLDTRSNARQFIATARPGAAIFVKYEFWLHYLTILHRHHIPTLLISAIFRKKQPFFQWYGKAFRQLLHFYHHIFVQDEASEILLRDEGIRGITVSGDTRFDRVVSIAGKARDFPEITGFIAGKEAWVAGSTWPPDETLLAAVDTADKWIIAPHEINEAHLRQIEKCFREKTVRYSRLKTAPERFADKEVLIIDNIGMLSSLYQYGRVAYIGGGFGKGIHNILEAAVWGIPVVFGPNFQKFKEARDLLDQKAAFAIRNETDFAAVAALLRNGEVRSQAGQTAGGYVRAQTGATQKIMEYLRRLESAA